MFIMHSITLWPLNGNHAYAGLFSSNLVVCSTFNVHIIVVLICFIYFTNTTMHKNNLSKYIVACNTGSIYNYMHKRNMFDTTPVRNLQNYIPMVFGY